MRRHIVVLGLLGTMAAGCHLLLGLKEATLFCALDDVVCPCQVNADCPGEPPDCHVTRCIDGVCRLRNVPPGTPCSMGFCSDTEGAEIYPESVCVQCVFDSHCEAGAYCAYNECARCDNGIQDGDESRPDCGGHCLQCLGLPCTSPEQCISGYCADFVCCGIPCTDICGYCDNTGECLNVPQLGIDVDPPCLGKMACNGGGACALDEGQPCVSDGACASLKCQDGKCTGPED